MYRGVLEAIIGRAAVDQKFLKMMLEDPERALEDYELTEKQITALKAIPPEALVRFSDELSKSIGKDMLRS